MSRGCGYVNRCGKIKGYICFVIVSDINCCVILRLNIMCDAQEHRGAELWLFSILLTALLTVVYVFVCWKH